MRGANRCDRTMMMRAILYGAMLATAWPITAYAYRPFDGTDAAVAEPGEIELELGYLGYLRQESEKSLIAPAVALSLSLKKERELVLEGRLMTPLSDQSEDRRTKLSDAALSFKQIHRNGVLQNMPGPSIASECGLLLPSLNGESVGATCTAIVSQRWKNVTAHFNAAIMRNREARWERFLGVILEGSSIGMVRPVFEVFTDRIAGGPFTNSALAGLIWQVDDMFAFDVGWRMARTEGQGVNELRAGFTWSLPAH